MSQHKVLVFPETILLINLLSSYEQVSDSSSVPDQPIVVMLGFYDFWANEID
jgi:hypothetical protein